MVPNYREPEYSYHQISILSNIEIDVKGVAWLDLQIQSTIKARNIYMTYFIKCNKLSCVAVVCVHLGY